MATILECDTDQHWVMTEHYLRDYFVTQLGQIKFSNIICSKLNVKSWSIEIWDKMIEKEAGRRGSFDF